MDNLKNKPIGVYVLNLVTERPGLGNLLSATVRPFAGHVLRQGKIVSIFTIGDLACFEAS